MSFMFLPKGGDIFRSTPTRKLLFAPKQHALYVAGWNIQCSDSRELDQRGLIVLRDEHNFCDDKYYLVKDFIRCL